MTPFEPPPPRKSSPRSLAGIPLKGWLGLVLTVAFMGITLYAIPPIRWFFLLSIPPGLVVALILYLLHRRGS
jgi:hypothetical protein